MRINPGLQVLSLVEDAIQIGTGHRARWITGLSVDEKRFVLSLGRGGGGSTPVPVQEPAPARRAEILSMLAPVLLDSPAPPASEPVPGHGLGGRLVPDVLAWTASYRMDAVDVLRLRAEAKVALHGCGRMGQLLAHILAAAGVGGLLLVDQESIDSGDLGAGTTGIASVGSGRARATARALQPIYPQLRVAETAVRGPSAEPLDLAVVVSGGNLPRLGTLTEDAAMLPVLFTDSGMHLGPLCLPGLTMCA
ncbi:MAG: ThiF family adenylyltransferase, partial [Micrococcaceae bacterium]|nr:ThiF family adenylyltransferase [Micrococcaceae bacterium]